MRTLRILLVGAVVFGFVFFLPSFEPVGEAVAAIAFIGAVAYGFALHPRRDVFYVRTTTSSPDLDRNVLIDHDQLAVRVETARLWLLFLPTALAVAFLVVTSANGTLWRFSIVERFLNSEAVGLAWGVLRLPVYVVGLGLWVWIRERRVLRNAEACSARSYWIAKGRVTFQFVTDQGKYGGGDDFFFGLAEPRELAALVFYNLSDIDQSKIAMSFLFHKIVLLGRGLRDLDGETAAAHQFIREPAG